LNGEFNQESDASVGMDDDELLAELGIDLNEENSITELRYVRSQAEKKAAEEIANRTQCEDFEQFKHLFESVRKDIETGNRKTIVFRKDAGFTKTTLQPGQFIIIGSQTSYIAEIGRLLKLLTGKMTPG